MAKECEYMEIVTNVTPDIETLVDKVSSRMGCTAHAALQAIRDAVTTVQIERELKELEKKKSIVRS